MNADNALSQEPPYVEIYRPQTQQEVVLLRMALEPLGIAFYITNEGVSGLFHIVDSDLGDMRLMVDTDRAEDCLAVLQELGFVREA